MKIKQHHLDYLREKITEYLNENPEIPSHYELGNFDRASKVKDLQTRFNFDLLEEAVGAKWVCDNIYPYANDSHVKAALRAICPTVVRHY